MPRPPNTEQLEWIVTDGTGAFAMGCQDQVARRKYHSFLSIADGVIAGGGKNLVLSLGEEISAGDTHATLNHAYQTFESSPWPTWTWTVPVGDGETILVKRRIKPLKHCCRVHMDSGFGISYSFSHSGGKSVSDERKVVIKIRPKLLSRPIHALMEKNSLLNGKAHRAAESTWIFHLYPNDPKIIFSWGGVPVDFVADGNWEPLDHPWEAARGYSSQEDCYVPGSFNIPWNGAAELKFAVQVGYGRSEMGTGVRVLGGGKPQLACQCHDAAEKEITSLDAKDASLTSRLSPMLRSAALSFAADIEENDGMRPTLLAGLPWFGPWARDLFVCMPGYSLAVGRSELPYLMMLTSGRRLLQDLSGDASSGGMNTHGADTPWLYLWALEQLSRQGALTVVQERVLLECGADLAEAVLGGAQRGVRAEALGGIRIEKGPWAKTWMDAMSGGNPITPRSGFPIEVNALFISGLGFLHERLNGDAKGPVRGHRALGQIKEAYEASKKRFSRLFSAEATKRLADVYCDGSMDLSIRPNCLWALALPRVPMREEVALATLKQVRTHLLTPIGLRTLSPSDRAYHGQCVGSQMSRDSAYHQGTVWPWLLGIYSDAVARWEGHAALVSDLKPVWKRLEHHLYAEGCVGEVSEIFDGDAPHEARGAPAQAWSACELLRVLSETQGARR